MIALIVAIIFLILLIVTLVTAFHDKWETENKIILSVLTLGCICIFVAVLTVGKSIYKQDTTNLLSEKAQIEYLLENNLDATAIKMAEKYNEKVENGNSYIYRFSIEDRSEFKISLEKY